MNVGLYQDPRGGGIGGGEYCLAVLARALRAEGHAVDIIHHQGDRFVGRLSDFFAINLAGVGDRPFPDPGRWDAITESTWRRKSLMRSWMRNVSEPYDAFVCSTHSPPPVCHARVGVLYVHFPTFDRHKHWPWNDPRRSRLSIKSRWRTRLNESWWLDRLASYAVTAVNSEFTRRWVRSYWGVDARVIHPPVDVSEYRAGVKVNRVLVLGRFTERKKHSELIAAFRRHQDRLPGWSLACLGGLVDGDRAYFETVHREAVGIADVVPNAPRDRVRAELSGARVFWHAMGIDVDEEQDPVRIEHFGIATVEAMAAGCVPVVINRGGQREIVTHGETGFLCNSLDEMAERTVELARDPDRAARMAAAARDRAAMFSSSVFERRMIASLRLHTTSNPGASTCS
jgi:glycosyltransferase involved in cell wall biosynthesis